MYQPPHIYEINAWTWLHALRLKYDDPALTLGSVPEAELEWIADLHLDVVWLMGVWQRSPAGIQIARQHPDLQAAYRQALPDFSPDDVVGSPYSIHAYQIDPQLGTRQDILTLRQRLQAYDMVLLLDFVPNHVATDHAWTRTQPDYLVQGTPDDKAAQPDAFFEAAGQIFAHGRDPYFPAWTDTAQLNAFHPGLRQAVSDLLRDIATLCDGVRCDMAMLVNTDVFRQTWGQRAGSPPDSEFWQDVIPAVKAEHPDFLFIAEVYWDMAARLHQLGFDYCYDKPLYDHLKTHDVASIRADLVADPTYQRRLVRFIENHDEERAAAWGFNQAWMAALLMGTLPGAKLWHEGQFQGHRVKLPVQLGRRPTEANDSALLHFYRLLLREVSSPLYREGQWALCDVLPAGDDTPSHHNVVAYHWRHGAQWRLIVVNYGDAPAQAHIKLAGDNLAARRWKLRDILNNKLFWRAGDDLAGYGLFIDLPPWSGHLFQIEPA